MTEPHDNVVVLDYRQVQNKKSNLLMDTETWLSLIEQDLVENYQNYKISSIQDAYSRTSTITIVFDTIDDAVIFKLKHSN